jgi:ABC-2 type transport system ATP-binding protein
MLAGFVTPTAGTARICGQDVIEAPVAAKRALGYLPEGAPTYPEMTVTGFLHFIARIRGFGGAEANERMARAMAMTQLEGVRLQPIETLSKGFKRRVGLAQALLHDPPVLVLDEPTDGLDPNQKHEVRELIRRMAPEKAIVISTHILEEVDAVCTRAIIIARGKVLADALGTHLDSFQRITADPASMSVIRYTELRPFVLHVNHTGAQLASALTAVARPVEGTDSSEAVVGGSTD